LAVPRLNRAEQAIQFLKLFANLARLFDQAMRRQINARRFAAFVQSPRGDFDLR